MIGNKVATITGAIVLLVVIIIVSIVYLGKSPSGSPLSDPPPRLIVVSFDGFRADYVSPSLTPTLWALRASGSYGNMFPQFVSKTFPNHFSIATGLHEESHGIVDNDMFDPETGLRFTKPNLDSIWWDNGYSLPIWIANQRMEGRKSGAVMWPGSGSTFRGERAHYFVKYNKSIPMEDRVDLVLDWMSREENAANLVMLYMEQPDSTAHTYGPFSQQVRDKISMLDNTTSYLIKGLRNKGLYETTDLIFLSDHGMSEIKREKSINLTKILDTSVFEAYGGSQVIGIRPKNSSVFDTVLQMLREKSTQNHFKVYLKSEIPEEYHYRNHRRIQPIILEAEPGYEISFPKWQPNGDVWGNHGNNNTSPEMQSLFLAIGPGFRRAFNAQQAFYNTDLYPLMTKILRIEPEPGYSINGTLEVTGNFLRD